MTVDTRDAAAPAPQTAGRVEARGIDHIPDAERHGRPAQLFWVWASANVNYLYVVLGGLLTLLGLGVREALAVVLVGNLFWLPVGFLAVSGPASGTPSSIVTRAMYGIRGNRWFVGALSWPVFIAYEAINLALGSLAAFAFTEQLGLSANRPVQVLVVLATAAVTLTISVYGHATILRASGAFTAVLALVMAGLAVSVAGQVEWAGVWSGAGAAAGLSGWPLWATMAAGITIIASSPLSWGIGADYARYLPAGTPAAPVALWTAAGSFVPAVILGSVGVLAGSLVDMTDPQTALAAVLPGWFYPVFLLFVVLSSMTNNILTMYSSGLCLQAVGLRLPRTVTVLIDGILGVSLAAYALFVSDFIDALSTTLELTVALLGPTIAVYATDIVLRRNRYLGPELHAEHPAGRYWFTAGWNLAGFTALALGTVTAALCLSTTAYQGPVAAALDGADLSALVGPAVAVATYLAGMRLLYPGHHAATSLQG